MDIRVLQYFLAVAREGSITRAAQTLHMTQPPLSRQLMELEDEIGKRLFIRGSKKVTLTEDGVLLKKRAEEIVALMEKTKSELSSHGDDISGEIYIGCGETDAVSAIAKVAGNLLSENPLIRYHIFSGNAEHIMERLDNGLIDLGLLIEPFDISKYNFIRLPVKDTWGVLMRKDSPLAQKDSVSAEEIWDKPLILSRQTATDTEMLRLLKKDLSQLNVVATYNLLYNASRFVKMGMGYAVALDKIINTGGDSELCFRPLSPLSQAELCIVWKKNQVFSRAVELFLRKIQEEFDINI